ncbi:unnamed protein product [Paramecium sonneborni]|uniref:TNFR-Cys domain-containing protein n=1 Tax=Paramecium sonneborni TaxID=65129 RepID=A0A8S1NIP8_9CILI|nr:unnamed protein product [Paramecium sonneborni]
MLLITFVILSFLGSFQKAECSCKFKSYGPIVQPNQPQIIIDLYITDWIVENNNVNIIGYGIWTKYQPFTQIYYLSDRESSQDDSLNRLNKVQGGQFIYSIKQIESSNYILVVSIVIDQIEQKFMYNIFYSFTSTSDQIQISINNTIVEGQWIFFFVYFDQSSYQTIFGIYNSIEKSKTKIIHDLPSFQSESRHSIGGIYSYIQNNDVLVQLTQFFGKMSTLFIQVNESIDFNLDTCFDQFMNSDFCYDKEYRISKKNQQMNGQDFIKIQTLPHDQSIYLLQGWAKLDMINENFKETIIFRITINENQSDDTFIGDREVLLKYFQSSIPGENGFEISTYSYSFPIKQRYKSQDDDKISDFDDQYSRLLVNWHYFQYEIGTLNNDGQPLLTIYFPSLNKYYRYVWSKNIKHFTGAKYFVYIGGDNYAKSFFKGYISDILLFLYCRPQLKQIVATCDDSCLECFGPTSVNCLSCHENNNRQFSRIQNTCKCQEGYIDLQGQQDCLPIKKAFTYIQKQEIQLDCDKKGYSHCEGEKIECNFGYFLFQNQCIQCPENQELKYGIHISCFNCYIQPITFSKSLICTMDVSTFYSNPDYQYQIVQRNSNNVSFYEIKIQEDKTFITQLCSGCLDQYKCKQGYYRITNLCQPCLKDCQLCQNSKLCTKCFDGYYLDGQNQCLQCLNCKKCLLTNQNLYCETCQENQILQNNVCISCGVNCKNCESNGYCNYCVGDPSKYYLTIDGRNCRECNIENCIYCFEYVLISGQYITTFDINFKIYSFDSHQVQFGCSLCNENYNYNQNTKKCEQKSNNDDGCEFAVILDSNLNQQCIISLTNNNAVQVTSCQIILHCQQCIHKYIQNESYCVQCKDGYYSELLTGQCQKCINNCKTCLQQNVLYKDYWKWSVKSFYKYFINTNHLIEDYGQAFALSNLEVICTSCQLQYILFENQCIQGCQENCNICEIKNGKATCIQCQEGDFKFLKTQDMNGGCLQCPSNCVACIERNQEEIADINPYYILTDSNAKYTRKCFEKSEKQDNYYFDYLTQTITVCTEFLQCYHKYLIQQNIFCDWGLYYQSQSNAYDDQFDQKNILISQFYDKTYLSLFETQQLYEYLNKAQVRHVEYLFTFIQGDGTDCQFEEDLQIYSQLQQNVFTLQQIDIIFKGWSYPTSLKIFNELTFSNYTKVTFQNIQFSFIKLFSKTKYFIINLFNLKPQLILNFDNCIFTMSYYPNRNFSFMIKSNIPYSLFISNLLINNFYVSSSDIFTFISQSNIYQNTIQISDLKIQNSYLFNSTFIRYQANKQSLLQDSFINDIQIIDTIFIQSNFIVSFGLLNYTSGTLRMNKIILLNVQILEKSTFLYSSRFQSLYMSDLIFNNSKIVQRSSFYSSNIINLKGGIINNTQIMNSTLINNIVEYSRSELDLKSCSKVQIEKYQILNTEYDEKQQIMKIIKCDEIIQLSFHLIDFSFINGIFISELQEQEISYYSSMMYIECQICYLDQIYLLRGHGLPEMTFLNSDYLEINNFRVSSIQLYINKPFHSSFDCVEKFVFKNMHFFLFIGYYQIVKIDSVEINSSLSFNNPFLILQGYDLMQRELSEFITVTNFRVYQNILLIANSNKQTAILSIVSQQNCTITLQNINFTENHLNEYFQDSTRTSATTLLIRLNQGLVMIQNCHFIQNVVTNSSDSIIFIKSTELEIYKCKFQQSNIQNFSKLSRYLFQSEDQDLSFINLANIFPIKSLSGNAMIITQSLIIDNIFINQSFAICGGAFHINTQDISKIVILNSFFTNTNTLSDFSAFSIGGCLYIDGSLSKLRLLIKNTTFQTSYSRNDGGAIYIIPSESQNWIELENLIVVDSFSLQNSFLAYNPLKIEPLNSQIILKNISFYSTEQGFSRFIQQINELSEFEVSLITHYNPLISIHFGQISILNCYFIATHIQFLIKIKKAQNILLSNVTIQNSTFWQSSLLELNLKENIDGKIIMENLFLYNVYQFRKLVEGNCKIKELVKKSVLQCPQSLPKIYGLIQQTDDTQVHQNQLVCNEILIFQNQSFNFSLIKIESLNKTQQIIVKNMVLQNVICQNCQFGLFQIVDIYIQKPVSIQFESIKIENCLCGQTGCLSILKNQEEFNLQKQLSKNNRLLQTDNLEIIEFKLECRVVISNSIFKNNSANYGGSLFILEIDLLIINSLFYNNSAEIGGAIYFLSKSQQLYFYRTQFLNNKAQIAGVLFLNNQSLQLTKELKIDFYDNNSTQYSQNVFEKASFIININRWGQNHIIKWVNYQKLE